MNADGTNPTFVTVGDSPSWSPFLSETRDLRIGLLRIFMRRSSPHLRVSDLTGHNRSKESES